MRRLAVLIVLAAALAACGSNGRAPIAGLGGATSSDGGSANPSAAKALAAAARRTYDAAGGHVDTRMRLEGEGPPIEVLSTGRFGPPGGPVETRADLLEVIGTTSGTSEAERAQFKKEIGDGVLDEVADGNTLYLGGDMLVGLGWTGSADWVSLDLDAVRPDDDSVPGSILGIVDPHGPRRELSVLLRPNSSTHDVSSHGGTTTYETEVDLADAVRSAPKADVASIRRWQGSLSAWSRGEPPKRVTITTSLATGGTVAELAIHAVIPNRSDTGSGEDQALDTTIRFSEVGQPVSIDLPRGAQHLGSVAAIQQRG